MTNKLAKTSAFSNMQSFEDAQRIAKAICQSDIVPKAYQNNIPNTIVALEMANRIGISAVMVMQNLDVINGKPSWRSSFIISALNSCGRFKPLRFRFEGDPKTDDFGCRAWAIDKETNEELVGPKIDWKMVKAEGWLGKKGSKWKTMSELMFQYRAASFFGRLYAPDILTGMHSNEEIIDIQATDVTEIHELELEQLEGLFQSIDETAIPQEEVMNIKRIIEQKESNSYPKAIKYLKNLNTDSDDK